MATYVNFLRLTELATGEGSGTWGSTTNTNLELIGEALGYATQQAFGSDADATTTVADGVSDPARAMYYKITSAVSLTTTRTLTIAPNTLSRVMFIENATSGSQSIAISQGSGANVTIAAGKTAVVYLDGAGSGAAVVDAMAGVDPGVTDTLAEVLVAGNATGGTDIAVGTGDDITFADSSKAIFGAGSDLQIYHDGSNSYIDDAGTGDLLIRAENNLFLKRTNSDETYLSGAVNGAVTLFHNNNAKIATTISGIDVTGTATMDGLTVDGDASISSANARLRLFETDTTDLNTQLQNQAGDFFIKTIPDDASASTTRLAIDHATGDISFYNTAGTSQALYWDASAESLGIGTSSPTGGNLHVAGSTDSTVRVEATSGNDASLFLTEAGTGNVGAQLVYDGGDNKLYFKVGNNTDLTRMTIERDTGNVGIGTDSPTSYGATATTLEVKGASGSGIGALQLAGADGAVRALLYAGGSTDFVINTQSNHAMGFNTNNARAMTIDAGGSVLIGKTTPTDLHNTWNHIIIGEKGAIISENGAGGVDGITLADNAYIDSDTGSYAYQTTAAASLITQSGGVTKFSNAASGSAGAGLTPVLRMTIDASGNLMVGRTNASFGNTGHVLAPSGFVYHERDGGDSVVYLNRLTSDGDIIRLYKDSAFVGSVACRSSGGNLQIITDESGLDFGGDGYLPIRGASITDNSVDLGSSSFRYKDLYLSGGAYIGGTVAANKLDDYEEGTWIPLLTAVSGTKTWTYSAQRGTYTKVGNLVTVFFNIQLTSNGSGTDGNARLTGLPFASATDTSLVAYYAFFWKQLINTTDVALMGQLPAGGDYITFLDGSSSYPDISYLNTSLFVNDRRVRGSIQYRV